MVITSSDIGGSENVVRELALRLDRSQFEPVVCSLRPCGRIADEVAATGVRVLTLGMSYKPRVIELAKGVLQLARWIDAFHVDLVHSFLYRANVVSRLSARFSRRRPIVVSSQRSMQPTGDRLSALASRWTNGLSDRILAVSEAVRNELIKAEGLRDGQVVVIGNGVDVARYETAAPIDRKEFGLSPDAILVGGVGRLSLEKGFDNLLDGVAIARAQGAPIQLLIVGTGPERAALGRQVEALGLNGHVKFVEARRDLRDVYASLDIFALPSHHEGSPNVLLEAMAAARPIIASNVGGVPELIEHERSGILVGPGVPDMLAQALARLAADPELRHNLGTEARTRVRRRFEMSRMVAQHSQLYQQLLLQRTRMAHTRSGMKEIGDHTRGGAA